MICDSKCFSLWSKLVEKGNVHYMDDGLFIIFKSFYNSFAEKQGKKPCYKDALLFLGSYEKNR